MKCVRILLCFLFVWLPVRLVIAQTSNTDSLHQLLKEKSLKPRQKYDVLNQLSGYYLQHGRTDSLKNITRNMLLIAQQLKNDTLVVQSYLNIGNYLVNKADFEASLEFYFKALHLAEYLKLSKMMILLNNNIGGEYEDLQNFTEALKYTKKVKQLLADTGKKTIMHVFNTWHMAYDYLNMNKPDSALHQLQMASKLMSDSGFTGMQPNFIKGHILWSYGQVYEQLNNNTAAAQAYQRAITYNDSLKLNTPLVLTLNSYSKFLYAQSQLQQAKLHALRAMKQATQDNFALEIINSASVLSKIYTKLNKPDSANYYFQLKDTYQQKVFNQQRTSRLQDITFTEQIHQAEEQARLAELEEQRKHNIQYAGIAIAIISFVVLFLLLSRSTVVSPRLIEFLGVVGLLILFEFINLILHPVIGKYTHHSPLLMLAIMVVIAALLVPMHHKLEKWIKHKLIAARS